jgi:hypothetical protein
MAGSATSDRRLSRGWRSREHRALYEHERQRDHDHDHAFHATFHIEHDIEHRVGRRKRTSPARSQ